jgi:hypothetical protein
MASIRVRIRVHSRRDCSTYTSVLYVLDGNQTSSSFNDLSFDTPTVAVGHRSVQGAHGARSLLLTERARPPPSQSPDISSALIVAKLASSFSSSSGYAGASSFIVSRMIEKVEMWENHLWSAGITCHGA